MFKCCQKKDGESVNLSSESVPTRRSWLRRAALIGGLAVGPHALCIVGAGAAALGVGGGVHAWCGGHDADGSYGVGLRRLPSLPKEYKEFSADRARRAEAMLLTAEPRFREVIAAKQKEANGAPIKAVFLEDDKNSVSVVFCANGALCPCTVPQLYEIGHRSDVISGEKFPGQYEVLMALYREQ